MQPHPVKFVDASFANTNYSAHIAGIDWSIGAGYMRGLWLGSPMNFFNNANIGAWDINAQVHIQQLTYLAEYVDSTPNTSSFGSFKPIIPGSTNLKTWDVGVSYTWHDFILSRESVFSAD